jgi:hypothetical protein
MVNDRLPEGLRRPRFPYEIAGNRNAPDCRLGRLFGVLRIIASNLKQIRIEFSEKKPMIRIEFGQKSPGFANRRFKPCC